MTEPENPQKQNRGFSVSLESAKKPRRAFHIPTAPAAAARLVQNPNLKGASSTTVQTLSRLILRLEKTQDVRVYESAENVFFSTTFTLGDL
jgi:hypothetical protein